MKRFITLPAAVAAMIALASCQSAMSVKADASVSLEDGPCPIEFTTKADFDASVSTKTSAVTTLATFNVNCVTGTPGTSETSVFNVAFSGSTTYTAGQYWPTSDPGYAFYAANLALTPTAKGPTVVAANTSDVVCAVLASPVYKSSNELNFKHIFARLGDVSVAAPSGYSVSSLNISITPKTSGTYNLYSGNGKTDGTGWSATNDGSAVVIASNIGTNSATDTYLVPGSYTLSASYTLTKGVYSESFSKTAPVSIKGGCINAISTTLPAGNASEISFTVSVSPWTNNSITASFN